MSNKDLTVKIDSKDSISIINNSEILYENCHIKCKDEWGNVLISKTFEIEGNSNIVFEIGETTKLIFTEIYHHQRLIYKKTLNDICFVLLSTKIDNKKTDDLIKQLHGLVNHDIAKFTLNYHQENKYCNTVRLDISENLYLSEVLLNSLESNHRKYIYIDNNLNVRNFNFLQDFFSIKKTPIFNKKDEYYIGPTISKVLKLKDDSTDIDTKVIIYDKQQKSLFQTISTFCKSEEISQISEIETVSENIIFSSVVKSLNSSPSKIKMVEFIEDDKQFNDFFLSNQSFYKKTDTDCSFVYCNESTRNRLTKLQNKNTFEEKLVGFYRDITFTEKRKVNKIQISTHCVRGPFVEVNADASRIFEVSFLDVNGRPIHVSNINGNMWTRLNHKFYYDYSVVVKENGQVIYQNKLDLKGKRVYIAIESSSLGDSLAWFPYAEEFRKKHECELLVSTFNNNFFIENYPDITFVSPGEQVNNLTAMYSIGWFYNEEEELDYTKCPTDFRNQPLQKTASDILGLEFKEIRPKITFPKKQKQKKIGIAIHGTAQSKYWNNPTGWQQVTDYLIKLGYEVVIYSREEDGYMGNFHPKGANKFPSGPLSSLIDDMVTCEFFIGIGSGLSWLAWAIELPIVLISGFSKEFTETTSNTWRVINNNVCTGCFNTHRLNASDWNWCPVHKGTKRQFECTKQISSEMVIDKVKDLIKSL